MHESLTIVGKNVAQPDGPAKATGEARYTVDLTLPEMLYAKILRSPHAHAKILNIETYGAERLPGVEAVITFKDIPNKRINMGKSPMVDKRGEPPELRDQYILTDKARYMSDAVAAVAAVDEDTAQTALDLIEVVYEELPAVFDPMEAMKPHAPRIHDYAENNVCWNTVFPPPVGDVEKGFGEADYVIEETFHSSKQKHCPLENTACVARFDEMGKVTIWSNDQEVFLARKKIADLYDMPEDMVRWITPHVGGAFGIGLSLRAEPVCVALAKKTGKPVKLVYTPEEQFTATENRNVFIQTGKIGVKRDGTITAMQTKAICDAGAYFRLSLGPTKVNLSHFLSLYRCPNRSGESQIVYTNTPVSGGMRGYGNPQAMWALEQLIDMAAEKIGMDPLEFRLKNHRQAGEPSWNPSVLIESCALDECIRLGAEKIGWKEKRGRGQEGTIKRGIGMAIASHVSGVFPHSLEESHSSICLHEDGSADLVMGSAELGQGVTSAMAQIAAEELGIRFEDVHVIKGDTDVTLFDIGQHASRTTYVMGNAVKMAAAEARGKLMEMAGRVLERPPDTLDIRLGMISIQGLPHKATSVADVIRASLDNVTGEAQITGACCWEAKGNPASFQAVFAEVEVDTISGMVNVVNLVAAHDIGRAINPMNVEGQLEGAITQGLGYALMEDYLIDKKTGSVMSLSFLDYRIPTALDLPKIDVIIVEEPSLSGPFGAKSVGENGIDAVAAAIGNALYDAAGVRIKTLPITPEKVIEALESSVGRRRSEIERAPST